MNKLLIYPTSRAIRKAKAEFADNDTMLPQMMRMDELEQRSVVLGELSMVDTLQRVLLLREAADFEGFAGLKADRTLVRFLSGSESFFRFFEELSGEGVDLDRLSDADAYAEFGKHIDVLSQLKERYRKILAERGLTDRMFVPEIYTLNDGFVAQYEQIEIYLEGLLSRYEMELLQQIAYVTQLHIHYTTSRFSSKMEERFAPVGIRLPQNSEVTFDLGYKQILHHHTITAETDIEVISTKEHFEQIAASFVSIEQMVQSGIDPSKIVLILPDESFKEAFRLYDKLNNLNFAMGFDYANGRNYKILDAILTHMSRPDADTAERLERYGLSDEKVRELWKAGKMPITSFFEAIDTLELTEGDPLRIARVAESRDSFIRLFGDESLTGSEWLQIWLQKLSEIRIDDLRGGLITVMGVLETRGVSFDGVVIVDFNEGIVPATSAKDQFLNSQVRAFADLPTKTDREALQKHYYHRLLSQSQKSTIIYTSGDNKLPSKFLYELGLESAEATPTQLDLLYDQPSRIVEESDPIVSSFDPTAQTWSASRLNTWLSCKRKYYYRYIRGIKSKPDTEINEGSFLHQLLDHLYRRADHYDSSETMRQQLHKLMDELLPHDSPRIEYYKILWKRKLEPFIEHEIKHFGSGWRVAERESGHSSMIQGLHFKGRIDRIDIRDGKAMVIDYKTGKLSEANRAKNLDAATDFQMNIYSHLLRDKYPNATFAFQKILEEGELVEAAAMEEKEEYLMKHLKELSQTHKFTATKTDKLAQCKYCEFALMCGRGEYL